MITQADWIVIGRFGRPHGIKGFVTIQSFTDPRDNILRYTDWHVYMQQSWKPIKLLSLEVHIKAIIAQIDGFPGREAVAELTNIEIAVSKDQLAPLEPGEYYWHQLVGMTVVNQQGDLFGQVSDVMPTGSNDVLLVQGEKKHLIPYLPGKYIVNIDDLERIITVDWDLDF